MVLFASAAGIVRGYTALSSRREVERRRKKGKPMEATIWRFVEACRAYRKREGQWPDQHQLANELGITFKSCNSTVVRLRKYGFIRPHKAGGANHVVPSVRAPCKPPVGC